MKIINPASSYYSKYATAKAGSARADAAAAAKGQNASAADKATGITNSLEMLARIGDDSQASTGISSFARDIYQLGQTSLYATLSEFQKSGIKKFLDDDASLSDAFVYSSENIEFDDEALARAAQADPSLGKPVAQAGKPGKELLETL